MSFTLKKTMLALAFVSFFPLIACATDATNPANTTNPTSPTTPTSTTNPTNTTIDNSTNTGTTNTTTIPNTSNTSAPNTEPSNTDTPSSTNTGNTTDTTNPSDTVKQAESFQSICLNSWLKRVNDVGDKVSYKNFGEKYCACAQTQPLDTDAAVDKAIQVCMSRTLLRDSVDALEESIGIDKATDKDVGQYCQDRWNLIYPQMTDQAKQVAAAFCECSKPKLVELLKKSDNMTDKDYYDQIDAIAASCSGQIAPSQTPSKTPAE